MSIRIVFTPSLSHHSIVFVLFVLQLLCCIIAALGGKSNEVLPFLSLIFFLPIMYHIVFSRYYYHYHLFIYKCSLINFNFILAGTHQTASHISSSAGVLKNIICHLFTIFIINITCTVYWTILLQIFKMIFYYFPQILPDIHFSFLSSSHFWILSSSPPPSSLIITHHIISYHIISYHIMSHHLISLPPPATLCPWGWGWSTRACCGRRAHCWAQTHTSQVDVISLLFHSSPSPSSSSHSHSHSFIHSLSYFSYSFYAHSHSLTLISF